MLKIDEYIKMGMEVEEKEKCPYCKGYVIQHIDDIFICPKCKINLIYDFKNKKWVEQKKDSQESKK